MKNATLATIDIVGQNYLARLESAHAPAELRPVMRAFAKAQKELHQSVAETEAAKRGVDAVRVEVTRVVTETQLAISTVADALVGASLGTRRQPFAEYGGKTPSQIIHGSHVLCERHALAMVEAVLASSPPEAVRKAAVACKAAAESIGTALAKLTVPELAYRRAVAARVTALDTWKRACERLKKHAAVVWEHDEATFDALFADPAAVQAPVRHRRRTATKTPASGDTPIIVPPAPTPPAPTSPAATTTAPAAPAAAPATPGSPHAA